MLCPAWTRPRPVPMHPVKTAPASSPARTSVGRAARGEGWAGAPGRARWKDQQRRKHDHEETKGDEHELHVAPSCPRLKSIYISSSSGFIQRCDTQAYQSQWAMHRTRNCAPMRALSCAALLCALCPALGFAPTPTQLRPAGRLGPAARQAAAARRLRPAAAARSLRAAAEPVGDAPAFAASDSSNKPTRHFAVGGDGSKPFRIVLIAGFEVLLA